MKRYIFLIAMLFVITSFKTSSVSFYAKPKLYPEIEKFYASLPTSPTEESKKIPLHDLYSVLVSGISSDNAVNIVFTCSDNSFRSVAAQVILQSLVSVNKYNKIVVFSTGNQSAEINTTLLKILAKHGFIATEQTNNVNGKKSYEIKFGDNVQSFPIYSKQVSEAGLPKNIFMQMKLCSVNETICTDLPLAKFKETISYNDTKTISSEDELDKEFTAIATDILWAFNQTKQ